MTIRELATLAKAASAELALYSAAQKAKMLNRIADALAAQASDILVANRQDLVAAEDAGLSPAMLDRLMLNEARLDSMIQSVRQVATLPDPVGEILEEKTLNNGLLLTKQRVPLGVIAIIYESRPNVTVDAGVLCLKSGNAVILRGGKEAIHTNTALAMIMQQITHAVQFVTTTDHADVTELVQLPEYIDVVIPRGGERLIRAVVSQAWVPVLKHYKGVCHIYVAASADQEQALSIIENAKCQRPGVCNAMETLLVDEAIVETFLPCLRTRMVELGVTIHDAERVIDWGREYLSLDFSLKVVRDVQEAVTHINMHGSHHSEAILTHDTTEANYFHMAVDSAVVYVNASTRFTDGECFGMGAEIGISTDKLHARGPMGLPELCTYKYLVTGNGQIR